MLDFNVADFNDSLCDVGACRKPIILCFLLGSNSCCSGLAWWIVLEK